MPSTSCGRADLAARMVMPKLSEFLGQQVVIDNRRGAIVALLHTHVALTRISA